MTVKKIGISIVLLLIMIGISAVAAWTPDYVEITPSNANNGYWVTAGSSDTTLLNVRVVNNTAENTTPNTPVVGAIVKVECIPPELGAILSPATKTVTSDDTNVTFTFRPSTLKGNATILATVTMAGWSSSVKDDTYQLIDHATPKYFEQIIYQEEAEVGLPVNITIRLKDQYGNIVDNKRSTVTTSEIITFLDSPSGGGFWEDGAPLGYRVTKQINESGNATVEYHLPTVSGLNVIQVNAGTTVSPSSQWITIKGIALNPVRASGVIVPNLLLADGKATATVLITLYDKYDNTVPNYQFFWWTSLSEQQQMRTNERGQVSFIYGPKSAVVTVSHETGLIPGLNTWGWKGEVTFTTPGAHDFILTGYPQIIPSLDVNKNSTSEIRAKVVDILGNPVQNVSVTFSIYNSTASANLTSQPYITDTVGVQGPITVISDANGYAKVTYHPGRFPKPWEAGFNFADHEYATGQTRIEAIWNISSKYVTVQYKNYPHLRIETSAFPENITAGNTTDVTIKVIGDGYAMRKPVDVLLLENRGGSMLQERTVNAHLTEDRMWGAQNASKSFVQELIDGFDRIGIASYGDIALPSADLSNFTGQSGNKMRDQMKLIGKDNDDADDNMYLSRYPGNGVISYNDFSTLEQSLTSNHITLNTTIMNIVPIDSYNTLRDDVALYTSLCTKDANPTNSLRYGLYKSITHLRQNNDHYSKIRVVVGLMDDQWAWFGDPTAQGSLMQKPCGAAAGTGPYWPFEDPDTGSYSPMADWHTPGSYNFTGNWNFTNGKNNWQNMSNYAKDNNIVLFMVRYSTQTSAETDRTLQYLCSPTGGEAIHAENEQQLIDAFKKIALKIRQIAAVDTDIIMDFSNMTLTKDNITSTYEGTDIFEYVSDPLLSTYIDKFQTSNPSDKVNPPPYPDSIQHPTYSYIQDQTSEWANNYLNFTIGNISIGQTWLTNFRLRATKTGLINLFGNGSYITYKDTKGEYIGPYTLPLPDTYLIITELPTQQNVTINVIDILDGSINATPRQAIELVDVSWRINYTGHEPVKQILYYQYSPDGSAWSNNWVQFATNDTGNRQISNESYSAVLDVRDRVGWLKIKIYSYEIPLGGPSDVEYLSDPIDIGMTKEYSIRIS